MKLFLNRWAISYALTNILFLLLSIFVMRRYNVQVAFIKLSISAVINALFIALSVTVFKIKQGNDILKLIFGFLILLPIVVITKRTFGFFLFRLSLMVYLLALIIGITYTIAVFVVMKRSKEEEKELNKLLEENNKKELK